jgi:cytoskeletal protein CcmA (bactofilin family)
MLTRTTDQRGDAMNSVQGDSQIGGPLGNGTLLSVTGDRAKIEGKFQIADSLHIECEIGGELEVGGRLIIGQRGIVRADVHTVDALIMGTYEGNMVASGNVEIASTGRVLGNLQTDSLVIEKGGFFNGNVASIDKPRGSAAEPQKEALQAALKEFSLESYGSRSAATTETQAQDPADFPAEDAEQPHNTEE